MLKHSYLSVKFSLWQKLWPDDDPARDRDSRDDDNVDDSAGDRDDNNDNDENDDDQQGLAITLSQTESLR